MATCSLLGVWRPASFSLSLSRSFAWRWLILPGVRRMGSSPHTTAATDGRVEKEPRKMSGIKETKVATFLQIRDIGLYTEQILINSSVPTVMSGKRNVSLVQITSIFVLVSYHFTLFTWCNLAFAVARQWEHTFVGKGPN